MLAPKRNPGFLYNRFLGDVAENKKSETLRQGEESEMVDGRMRQQEKTKTAKLEHQEKLGGFNRFFAVFSLPISGEKSCVSIKHQSIFRVDDYPILPGIN